MKKANLLLTGVLSLSMLAIGCSSRTDSAAQSGDQLVIEWMAHPAYSMQSSDPKRVEYLKNASAEFEKTHANAQLKPTVLSSNINEAMAKLLEQADQGRAPDVAQIDSYIFPRYYSYLQPLDSYLEKAGIKLDDFFPFAQQIMKGPDGKIYGLQFTTDARVLYYRKDLVPAPPKTWADVLSIGKDLKAKGYDPLLVPGGRGEGAAVTSLWPFFWSQGGKLVDDTDKPVFGEGENREKMLNVLKAYQEGVASGVIPKRSANYGSESDLNPEIATGKVAMFLGGNWQAKQLQSIIDEKQLANWAVAPMPEMPGGKHVTTAGGWTWGIFTKDPAKQQAAFDFLIQTFVGDKGMTNWTNIGGYLPVRKSVYDLTDYQKDGFTNTFKEHLDKYAQMRPAAPAYQEVSTQLQIAASSVIAGSKTPEQALDDAWTSVGRK
ncbi:MAG: extracellular solute-binding protein [Tumebacillaceae bacterium]